MKKPIEHLPFFVYGTLLPGHHNYRRFFQKIKPVREEHAELRGYVLIGTKDSGFPYMCDSLNVPKHWRAALNGHDIGVKGKLLHFDEKDFPKILEALDYLEGVPDHYNREALNVQIPVEHGIASAVRAWTYYAEQWLVDELLPYPFVPDGDWHALHPPKKVKKHVSTKPEV